MEVYLQKIYYNPQHLASLSGPDKLYRYIKKHAQFKAMLQRVKKCLESVETYTLHREAKRKFKRNIIVPGIDVQWDADLMDMVSLGSHNKGVKYVLVCIDTFSIYAWVQALKSKKSGDVIEAFKRILQQGCTLQT